MSGILNISEEWDLLFDKKWKMWPQSWDTSGGTPYNESYIRDLSTHILTELSLNGQYWDNAIHQAVACSVIGWKYRYPDELDKAAEQAAVHLYDIVHKLAPQFRYIKIIIKSTLSGGNYMFDPNVEIEMDERYFGYPKGGGKEKYSILSTHLMLIHEGIFRMYGGTHDFPKAADYLPIHEYERGCRSNRFIYSFFPKNDPPYGYNSGKHIPISI